MVRPPSALLSVAERAVAPSEAGRRLSAARAGMVARHLQWTHNFDGANMEIVGLSQYHPTADNATAEGREQNRRVRIAVMGG